MGAVLQILSPAVCIRCIKGCRPGEGAHSTGRACRHPEASIVRPTHSCSISALLTSSCCARSANACGSGAVACTKSASPIHFLPRQCLGSAPNRGCPFTLQRTPRFLDQLSSADGRPLLIGRWQCQSVQGHHALPAQCVSDTIAHRLCRWLPCALLALEASAAGTRARLLCMWPQQALQLLWGLRATSASHATS